MYASLQHRFTIVLEDCIELLDEMAPGGGRMSRAQTPTAASSPSLRSREAVLVPMRPQSPMMPGGNVKVVVRVRGFLQRGKYARPADNSSG
jgi:hypothetical protein